MGRNRILRLISSVSNPGHGANFRDAAGGKRVDDNRPTKDLDRFRKIAGRLSRTFQFPQVLKPLRYATNRLFEAQRIKICKKVFEKLEKENFIWELIKNGVGNLSLKILEKSVYDIVAEGKISDSEKIVNLVNAAVFSGGKDYLNHKLKLLPIFVAVGIVDSLEVKRRFENIIRKTKRGAQCALPLVGRLMDEYGIVNQNDLDAVLAPMIGRHRMFCLEFADELANLLDVVAETGIKRKDHVLKIIGSGLRSFYKV